MPADVFISYAREDRARIEALSRALETEGIPVWWDREISGGTEFTRETEARLNEAKAVLVVWSKASVASTWVCDEATVGRECGNLVPVAIDGVAPRLGFRSFQTIDLANWHGDRTAPEFLDLVRALKARISGEAPPPISLAAPTSFARWRKHRLPIVAVAAAALAIIAGAVFFPRETTTTLAPTAQAGASPAAPSERPAESVGLAVIPFTNLSSDPEQEHFVDGLTEELLNWLGNVEGLRVPGRTSAFQFKGKSDDLRAIGERLAVDYLLEGSVRRSGSSLRITAQLIDAKTGYHRWSETYDREFADIFAIQDDIARIVVTEVLGKIPGSGAGNPAAVGDVDPRAHGLYLEGRAIYAAGGYPALRRAFEKFHEATEVDSRHAFAQAYLAVIAARALASGDSFAGFENGREAIVAQALAEAVRLKPQAADVLFAQGWVAQMRSGDRRSPITNPAIVDFYNRAVRANPRHVEALFALAKQEPSYTKAIELYERVLKIDPAHTAARQGYFFKLVEIGDLAKAGAIARQSLTLAPAPLARGGVGARAGIVLGDMALVGEGLFAEWDAEDRVSEAAWLRAATLANLGAVEEARFLYARAAAADHPPWPQIGRYHIATLGGDAAAALQIAEEIHQRDPPPDLSAAMLADALIRVGQPERAYDVLLATSPDFLELKAAAPRAPHVSPEFLTAAHALALAGRRAEARRLWQSALAAIERKPATIWSDHLTRALLHGNLGDRAAAIKNFQAAHDAGFRFLRSTNDCDVCVNDALYAASGQFAELVKIPEIAAIVKKIEAENTETLDAFNKKYGVLDKVRALMAEGASD